MNKQEYLSALAKALKSANVSGEDDILEEYGQHFDIKAADGYSEEEIAAKLAPPKEIAGQFALIATGDKKRNMFLVTAAVVLADISACLLSIPLYAWVFALAALSVASAALGVFVALGYNMWSVLPQLPLAGALLFGIALLALAALAAIGTEYCRLYVTQLIKAYLHWRRSRIGKNRHVSPPLPIHPQIQAKKRRVMRGVVLVSLAVFALCFIAGFVSMAVSAGSLEFWHVWHWFE